MPDPFHQHDFGECPVRFHPANGIPPNYAIWNLPGWIHHLSGICSVFCLLHLQADSGASRRDGDGRLW